MAVREIRIVCRRHLIYTASMESVNQRHPWTDCASLPKTAHLMLQPVPWTTASSAKRRSVLLALVLVLLPSASTATVLLSPAPQTHSVQRLALADYVPKRHFQVDHVMMARTVQVTQSAAMVIAACASRIPIAFNRV